MLIKMRAPLHRKDLQVLINGICLLLIRQQAHLWMDYIEGKSNLCADALSRELDLSSFTDKLFSVFSVKDLAQQAINNSSFV